MEAFTTKSRPRYLLIVFALAGDSTITRFFAIASYLTPEGEARTKRAPGRRAMRPRISSTVRLEQKRETGLRPFRKLLDRQVFCLRTGACSADRQRRHEGPARRSSSPRRGEPPREPPFRNPRAGRGRRL